MTFTPASFPTGYRPLSLDAPDFDRVMRLETWTFPSGNDLADYADVPLGLEWSRTQGVVFGDDNELAAIHASNNFETFEVPGAQTRVSGLSWVGVHPTHRRRGILKAMINQHFARSLNRGEAISALTASETTIYGRFGYGQATDAWSLTVPTGAALRPVPGSEKYTVRVEVASQEAHEELVDRIHAEAGRRAGGSDLNRPGWTPRIASAAGSFWADTPAFREGLESRRIVIVERDGVAEAFAFFRRKLGWGHAGSDGTLNVYQYAELNPAAAHALWQTLLNFDLMKRVEVALAPSDGFLTTMLLNRREAIPKVNDHIWIRLLDVPVALQSRRYQSDIDVVLEVEDALVPGNAGKWRMRAQAWEQPEITRADDEQAELRLDVRELGAAYLGGVSLASLSASGLVTELVPGALARASAAFSWPIAPAGSFIF